MDIQGLALSMASSAWQVLLELAPSLLLGAALAGLAHVLLPASFASRHLRGRGGVLKAVAFGVPLPLCSCGVLPAGLGLKQDGASDGAAVGFLISTPQTGVDSVMVSAAFLGWPFALFKVLSAAVTGVVGGWLTDRVSPGEEPADAAGRDSRSGEPAATGEEKSSPTQTGWPRLTRALSQVAGQGLELLRSIWGWLVVGVAVSVLIDVFVPHQVFTAAAAWGGLGASLAALVLSLPLYVCATASVPIAAALVANGLPASAALVFLMAGPATNAATVGAIHRAFGGRVLGVYLSTLILGSLGFGLGFDFLLGDTISGVTAAHSHGAAWWQVALTLLLLGLLAFFAASDGWRAWRRSARSKSETGRELTLSVTGMTCNGCVRKLERTLGSAPGVEQVSVDLEPGRAIVRGQVDEGRVRELIAEAGFHAG